MKNRFVSKKITMNSQMAILIICIVLEAVYLIPCFFLSTPFFIDGINTLSLDFFFQGYDWKSYLCADGYYYKYGMAILYMPVFFLFHHPTNIYLALLLENTFLSLIVPIFCFKICQKHLKTSIRVSIFISFTIGLLPCLCINNKYTWSENILMTFPWIILYMLLNLSENLDDGEKVYKEIVLLAVFAGFCYMAHSRGIVILTVSVLLAVGIVLLSGRKNIKYVVWLMVIVLLLLILDTYLNTLMRENVFPMSEASENSSISSVISLGKLRDLLSFNGIKTILLIFCGWIYNVFVSSCGLVCFGLVSVFGEVITFIKKHSVENKKEFIIIVFTLLFIGSSFLIGALFFFDDISNYYAGINVRRSDKLVYGRYIEPASMFLSFIGIWELMQKKREKTADRKILSILVFEGIFVVFFAYISNKMNGVSTWIHNLATINSFIDLADFGYAFVSIDNYGTPLIIIGELALICFCIVLMVFRDKKKITLFYCMFFLFIYVRGIKNIVIPIDKYYKSVVDLSEEIISQIPYIDNNLKNIYLDDEILRCAYQYNFPDYYVLTQRDKNSDFIENTFIISKAYEYNKSLYKEDYFEIISEPNIDKEWHIYIKGEELNSAVRSNGINTEKIVLE